MSRLRNGLLATLGVLVVVVVLWGVLAVPSSTNGTDQSASPVETNASSAAPSVPVSSTVTSSSTPAAVTNVNVQPEVQQALDAGDVAPVILKLDVALTGEIGYWQNFPLEVGHRLKMSERCPISHCHLIRRESKRLANLDKCRQLATTIKHGLPSLKPNRRLQSLQVQSIQRQRWGQFLLGLQDGKAQAQQSPLSILVLKHLTHI